MNKFLILICICTFLISDTTYREDDTIKLSINHYIPNSHIKVFIPSMPYLYLSKLINGTLIRSCDNDKGWEFMLATKLERKGNLVYIFTLRKNVKFQDGSKFNADSVIKNFKSFQKNSKLYSVLRKRLKSIKKISDYKIQFTFNKPFELFLDKLTRFNFYTDIYLNTFGWGKNNLATAVNTLEPGPYGLGPYTLIEGYATGKKQTPIIKIKANPYYYEKGLPYIDNITIYTQLTNKQVLDMALKNEGSLDIAPIAFNKKIETILSPYAKLVTSSSKHNISILFNLLRSNSILKNKKIRLALNEAIDQEKLLKFVYKNEGNISPTTVSTNYLSTQLATKDLLTHHKKRFNNDPFAHQHIKSILNGITLNVYTMDRYLFLWKGIEYQLLKYGVKINYTITNNEKKLFKALFENLSSPKSWDLITLGTESWSTNNPWSVFFHYKTNTIWSSIEEDTLLEKYINQYYETKLNSKDFFILVDNIIKRVYFQAYTLAVPSPNIVLAVNKEVDYTPSKILVMPLWKTKITPYHWSIRKKEYPPKRMLPILPKDIK